MYYHPRLYSFYYFNIFHIPDTGAIHLNYLITSFPWFFKLSTDHLNELTNCKHDCKLQSNLVRHISLSSSWAWFFSLFFIRKFHIELCHSWPTTYLQHLKKKKKKKKPCHFHIWYPFNYKFTSKFQIKHWNMLYNVHTCMAIFFHISYNPVSTHSINQNSYYKLCFTKIRKL